MSVVAGLVKEKKLLFERSGTRIWRGQEGTKLVNATGLSRSNRRLFGKIVFFFQAEDGIRDVAVTGVQTCALPIWGPSASPSGSSRWRSSRSVDRARRSPIARET